MKEAAFEAAEIFLFSLGVPVHINQMGRCSSMVKVSDLRSREIINTVDGRRLGMIKDIDIDLEEGRITAIILPAGAGGRFLGLIGKEEEIIVPWDKIVKIGMDVILVEVSSFTSPKTRI